MNRVFSVPLVVMRIALLLAIPLLLCGCSTSDILEETFPMTRGSIPISISETAIFGISLENTGNNNIEFLEASFSGSSELILQSAFVNNLVGIIRGPAENEQYLWTEKTFEDSQLKGYILQPGERATVCLEFRPTDKGEFRVTEYFIKYRVKGKERTWKSSKDFEGFEIKVE